MFAITNSSRLGRAFGGTMLAVLVSTLTGPLSCAQDSRNDALTNRADFLRVTSQLLETARKRHIAAPTNAAFAWEVARATFDRAEFATNDTERANLAMEGIAACRAILKRDTNCAPAHYCLGLNLGQLARTRLLGALPLVDEMEVEFKAAVRLDERFHFAGPHRTLGLLYLQAPTIGSVGSRSKARKHLLRAADLAPEFPENRLNLAEAFLHWGEYRDAREQIRRLEFSLPAARTNLVGEEWAASWFDWTNRLKEAKQAVAKK